MRPTVAVDENLKQFATETQSRYIDAVNEYGGFRKAGEALGVSHGIISRALKAVHKKAGIIEQKKEKHIKHLVIPDVQAKGGNDFEFLTAIGNYIVAKKPDVIVCIGDFADMESLSSYDRGMKSFEGRNYKKDIWAAREAMDALTIPLFKEFSKGKWKPRMVMTLGNHENRINRVINEDRKLEGVISTDDLPYQDWEIHPFLEVVCIDGIAYSHYFTSGVMGRPITTAQALLNKKHMSCFAGHQQGRMIAYGRRADGKEMTAIICGSCYEHDEEYLGPQGNQHFRGVYVLHEVNDGSFDEMAVSIRYLKENYL